MRTHREKQTQTQPLFLRGRQQGRPAGEMGGKPGKTRKPGLAFPPAPPKAGYGQPGDKPPPKHSILVFLAAFCPGPAPGTGAEPGGCLQRGRAGRGVRRPPAPGLRDPGRPGAARPGPVGRAGPGGPQVPAAARAASWPPGTVTARAAAGPSLGQGRSHAVSWGEANTCPRFPAAPQETPSPAAALAAEPPAPPCRLPARGEARNHPQPHSPPAPAPHRPLPPPPPGPQGTSEPGGRSPGRPQQREGGSRRPGPAEGRRLHAGGFPGRFILFPSRSSAGIGRRRRTAAGERRYRQAAAPGSSGSRDKARELLILARSLFFFFGFFGCKAGKWLFWGGEQMVIKKKKF